MARRVLMAKVSGGRVRGRPRLGWMNGVKVALGNREMTVEAARQCRKIGKRGEPWYICNWMSFTLPFLLGPVFFRTAFRCSGGYHLQRGGMPLHDAVGINCKHGATTEYQGADASILDKGCMLMIMCVLSDFTWLPLLRGGKSHAIFSIR